MVSALDSFYKAGSAYRNLSLSEHVVDAMGSLQHVLNLRSAKRHLDVVHIAGCGQHHRDGKADVPAS